MSKALLEVNNLNFHYGKEEIFKDLSFSIQNQEFISVVGPSGSGKTTLFRLLLGLEEPTKGDLLLRGQAIKLRDGNIGYVPQKDLLIPWRTIIDNVILPLELKGIHKKEAYKKAAPLFVSFGLDGTETLFPSMLSGGMKQRVSFMRAYLTGADILLLDEPFSALDAISRLAMQEWLLEQWKLLKKTIILITHDLDEALLMSDRIFVTTLPPMTKLKEVQISLSRPRTMEDVMNDSSLLSAKRELIQQFRKEGEIFDKRIK
ncbi:ABC transporter ATP-binding protein [Planococcus alpniumensis]|uniref:ABC transporter ATP-binding protein n=1 Tax=Planococcus alpniumensis TaxID=2708345 RepID=UPI001B8D435B